MEALFGEERIYKFLEDTITLIEKLSDQLREELEVLSEYEAIKEHLRVKKIYKDLRAGSLDVLMR